MINMYTQDDDTFIRGLMNNPKFASDALLCGKQAGR